MSGCDVADKLGIYVASRCWIILMMSVMAE